MIRVLAVLALSLTIGCAAAQQPEPPKEHPRLGVSVGSGTSWAKPLNVVSGNSATIVVYDTTNGSRAYGNPERLLVSCFFDQAVTVLFQVKHIGSSTWRTVNGNGNGDTVAASTSTFFDYLVTGYDDRIEVVTGGSGPTTAEVDIGVVMARDIAL